MAEIGNRYVKRGYWVNINNGPVMGATITTDVQTGTFIVALLALLGSLGVGHLWNLVTFAFHQVRARRHKSDALYWQQQALLRAQLPPTAFIADWIKLWWVWRKKATHVASRSSPYIPLGLLFITSIIAIGIFSSFVIDSTNLQVLADNPGCGFLDLDVIGDHIGDYKRDLYVRGRAYADECYVNSTNLPARCNIFLRPNLPLIPQRVQCPFDNDMCIDQNTTGVSVDSGLVNANDIIGWNLKSQDQVKFRRKNTCGAIKTWEYSQIINASDYPFPRKRRALPGEQAMVTRYWDDNDPRIWQNVTFYYSLLQSNISDIYSIGTNYLTLRPIPGTVGSKVVSGLSSDKADLTLTQIHSNNVRYTKPVDDPIFAAHKPVDVFTLERSENITMYLSDQPASTIACLQQYQFCIARNKQSDLCTELSGLPSQLPLEQLSGATDTQLVAIQLLMNANLLFDTSDASVFLEASKLLNNGYLTSLPDDQWIREVAYWEKLLWAMFQSVLSDYAIGYGVRNEQVQSFIRKPSREGERKLCGSQRMKKPGGFMNINVFGLAFVTAFSCVITLLDLVLLKFVIFVKSVRKSDRLRIDRWIQDGVFQLQRRAFESQGQGTWDRYDHEIPSMEQATELDELGYKQLKG